MNEQGIKQAKMQPLLSQTMGIDFNKFPSGLSWIMPLLSPLVLFAIGRLQAAIDQYDKQLQKITDTKEQERIQTYRVKDIEVKNLLMEFLNTKILKPTSNPAVAFNLFNIVHNQFELFGAMLLESGDLTKPLFGDIFRAWYSSCLSYAAQTIPDAQAQLTKLQAVTMSPVSTTGGANEAV